MDEMQETEVERNSPYSVLPVLSHHRILDDLFNFIEDGDMQKIESCLVYFINNAKGSANSQGPGGRTLLAWAVERGSLDAVDYLIRCRGIDVDAIDSRGRTAMAWAAMRGDYDISLHVANGLCMYVKDRNGRTPLSFAAEKGHITILLSLIANIKWWRENANDTNALQDKHWTYEDNKGHTPLWWAVVNDHQETAKTLAANDDGITLHTLIEEEYYIPMGSHFFIERSDPSRVRRYLVAHNLRRK